MATKPTSHADTLSEIANTNARREPKRTSLYALASEVQAVLAAVRAHEGEVDEKLEHELDEIIPAFAVKVRATGEALLLMQEKLQKAQHWFEIVRDRRDQARRDCERLSKYLGSQLARTDSRIEAVHEGVEFTWQAKERSTVECPPHAVPMLPADCVRHIPAALEADRVAIRKRITTGGTEELPEGVRIRYWYEAAAK